ncbi:MAG TPA: hypothetical protein VFV38_10650 [Ktedonobacteraceae bacterium]|nr:hypothetical protein [Ktedonobacteraceae bacterium]
MSTLVSRKNTVNRKNIVDFKLQTILFAFSILMHVIATSVAASYPLLGWLFSVLEGIGWTAILITWVIALIKGIQYGAPKLWAKIQTYARTHAGKKKAKTNDTKTTNDPFVSVAQLKRLRNNIDWLGLALHGMTPELEQARRTHFQMLNVAVPALTLPAQNAVLYARFECLTRFLAHFGFPKLESVQLQQKDFQFAWQWGSELEACLRQSEKERQSQEQALQSALSMAIKVHESIRKMYPAVLNEAGYYRLEGALRVLKAMSGNNALPPDQVQSYIPALQRDMDTLLKQLKQPVA